MRLRLLTVSGPACLVLSCAETASRPEPLALGVAQSAMDGVRAAYSRAAVAGDADAIAQIYADTAHLA